MTAIPGTANRSTTNQRGNIHVNIERLVLDGSPLAGQQFSAVRAALEAELERLLAAKGLAPELVSGGTVPHLRTADLRLSGRPVPADLGVQIAGAIYRGMGT